MEFQELQEKINNGADIKDCGLEITSYLKLSEKAFIFDGTEEEPGLIDSILEKDENGLWYINRYAYEIRVAHIICNWYGNIQFEKFSVDEYDFVTEKNVIDFISVNINDYNFFDMLDNLLENELEKRNSLPSIVLKLGNQLISKLDEMSDPKKLKKMGKAFKEITDKNPALLDLLKDVNLKGVMK